MHGSAMSPDPCFASDGEGSDLVPASDYVVELLPPALAPEHTFLSAGQVIARYGWGRTKGYRMLRTDGFPTPIGGDRYRLDALMEWEKRHQATVRSRPSPELPQRKRRRRASAPSI